MDISELDFDLKEVKKDLVRGISECSQRGLLHSTKWLAELSLALSYVKLEPLEYPQLNEDPEFQSELFHLAKTYFDIKEYDRCAFFTQDCVTPKLRFLYLYATYLSAEKKKIDNMTEAERPPDSAKNVDLKALLIILQKDHAAKKLDGFGLYLYGVMLKKLDLVPLAIEVLLEAIDAEPMHWGAWQELSSLIQDQEDLATVTFPEHWIKNFFVANSFLEQLRNDEALDIYTRLQYSGFSKSRYIMAQIAIAYQNKRDLDKAIEAFRHLQSIDPYRLDNLDTYSNLLYVKDLKTDLANLAHHVVSVDKYRVETCCVIGNYYSLRSEHQKAVLYFQRALKLNPQYLSAWTLMGHEFMEMKNTYSAIQSYRLAIEINKRDYRAWYGLGQTYEILKMPFYSLHYYKQAQQLRPNDSRMLIAVGETYEKLEKVENALKCYHKACNVGDIEGMALVNLARLYDNNNDIDNAAAAYTEYCLAETKSQYSSDAANLYAAYRYLANYHIKKTQLDDAYTYAYKCLEHEETKEEGKALLRTIAAKRGQEQAEITVDSMDITNLSLTQDSRLDDNA